MRTKLLAICFSLSSLLISGYAIASDDYCRIANAVFIGLLPSLEKINPDYKFGQLICEAGGGNGGGRGALAGQVSSRADALRAIDMVCEFLERTEPSNPAPLFLRRARQLVNHNFLQLMKELAPEAMASVARTVGVDPDSVKGPENP